MQLKSNANLVVVLSLLTLAYASSGDRSPAFQNCLTDCSRTICNDLSGPPPLPLSLRLTRWTCEDDCKYTCMHMITDAAIHYNLPIQQYYGKWPFRRILGMQEPASVLFSLLNLLGHLWGLGLLARRMPKQHPLRGYYAIWGCSGINAWMWSAVFHTRDLPVTEKLDYFAAALAILCTLYIAAIRLFRMYDIRRERNHPLLRPWTILSVLVYTAHVYYLGIHLPRFDYAYNMAFNLVIGLTHNVFWLLYAFTSIFDEVNVRIRDGKKSSRKRRAALFVLLTTGATALELLDFPPWKQAIDAHALWHLSTAPLVPFWYRFLIDDALSIDW